MDGSEQKCDISIPNYQTPISTPTEGTKGGVLIYVKAGINFKPRNDLKIYKSKELESAFIEIINKNESNTIIGAMYRHPCMNENDFIDNYLKELVDKISGINKKVFIAGDFNFNFLNTSTHNSTNDFFDTMMTNFLLPAISLPTKINTGKNTLIDNIFTNHIHPDCKSGNLEVNLSDGHLPSFLIIPKANQNHLPKKHNIFTRNTKNLNNDNLKNEFNRQDWGAIIDSSRNDVDHSLANYMAKLNGILDSHIPLKKLSSKQFKQRFKPWITNEVLNKIKEKNKVLNKLVKSKNPIRTKELSSQFKTLKNEISYLTRTGKKNYYQRYFTEHKDNIKKVWKGIKEIVNIKSKNYDYPTCLQEGNSTVTDPTAIANSFNDYFTSVADQILNKRKYNGNKLFSDFLKNRLANSFVFEPCTKEEIQIIILSLKTSKSYGPNSIPVSILHLLVDLISSHLETIFNISFVTGKHPNLFKLSKTIAIYKKGSKLLTSNYRPISLLSNLNKVLEKLVFNRLYNFLEESQCIYSLQFGFRKKHSTNHALVEITETIRKALDEKKFACGVFVDFQKAFDTVNHDILVSKLDHYGVRETENNWFKSYLTGRSQFVSILGFDSNTKPILHGVPQGSVLGPLLFLIYINDLHFAMSSKVFHFADDTNLLKICKSPKELQKSLNLDLKNLCTWLLANKISLNCDKTELIFFRKPGDKVPNIKIKLNGHRLFPSNQIKYLGVYLDEYLNGRFHCNLLLTKLKRSNGMLSKARHFISISHLKTLYFAIFSSHLTYGCQIWAQRCNIYNRKIFTAQNKAIRIMTSSHVRASSKPIYRQLDILKLDDHIYLQNCLMVHDALSNNSPNCFSNYFKVSQDIHSLGTRGANNNFVFVKHSSTLRYGIHSITSRSIFNWNHATKTLKQDLLLLTRNKLAFLLKQHFINSYM